MPDRGDGVRSGPDVVVLGAGIVGVCTALHLQARGRRVCLVDRGEPGHGTSFGNAGLIERSGVVPYAFPRSILQLASYLGNRHSALRFEWAALPGLAPWLWRYWRESSPRRLERASQDLLPLIERSVTEHEALIRAAGMQGLVRTNGWIDIYRNRRDFDEAAAEARWLARRFSLNMEVLPTEALLSHEPGFLPQAGMAGGIYWLDPWSVRSPVELVKGYASLFVQRGGQLLRDEVRSVEAQQDGWAVRTVEGTLSAPDVVIALGPDALDVLSGLGYDLPLRHKRGYHMHFRPAAGQAVPIAPLCDSTSGFVLASMNDGVRLTTGIELTLPSTPPRDGQLRQAEQIARSFWPLGEAVELEPWMGRRPCLPDMRPVIGAAPRHRGLWFNFGHAHHGLTLGPVSGRLLAEMMTGEKTLTDPAPYSAARFD